MINGNFWRGRKVFLTGHTGFKGSWLCLWLSSLGARVTGYAQEPPTEPSLYRQARVDELVTSVIADVRDLERLKREMLRAAPEVIIHMAAQPLVRDSYKIPVETYGVNVMGTVHLLEAVRSCPGVRAVVNVTTDKVYENREWCWGYRENEPFGGYDPYSNSKACSELVTAAYRSSYFTSHPTPQAPDLPAVATARAGNVIGGGDWATDRLVPDVLRAILAGESVLIRNPRAIRPWQHVLEPLSGYLLLAQRLYEDGAAFASGWNFGPPETDAQPVQWLVERLCRHWGDGASWRLDAGLHPHEAHYLKLDCSKARTDLGWRPRWSLDEAIELIVEWTRAYQAGGDLRQVCLEQIGAYGAN
ncbi:CDP-glucose 4,6-dehydratase [Geobacter sp.]|uniref:CDP-glucose 4,6-dehydratase n=1 Tax=Geobacter sp. TaxID=46610 RepID=UPI0026314A26|nr:CDP-glucose 4,6-dehydratase [Geobacter sp.]